jgi:hypothetical protein
MIISVIVGVITGIIASLIVWCILFHMMSPKIGFADKIKKAKTKNTKTGYYYQFKIGNLKRRSSVFDISIRASLYLPEFPSNGVTNIYSIPTDAKQIFELTPKKDGETGWNRRVSLDINNEEFTNKFNKNYYSKNMKNIAAEKIITLEDLLSITEGAFIRIHISAMDAFSGSRKVIRSKDYKIGDVEYGQYERYSFNLIPVKEET